MMEVWFFLQCKSFLPQGALIFHSVIGLSDKKTTEGSYLAV